MSSITTPKILFDRFLRRCFCQVGTAGYGDCQKNKEESQQIFHCLHIVLSFQKNLHLILSDIASKVKNRIKLYYFYKKMVKNL